MIKRTAFILIGDDCTGKTTFQKYLILHLCGIDKFNKLNTNLVHHINHPESPRKLKTLFTINRSIQEKLGDYKSIQNYFDVFFKDADVCVLSSHVHGGSINDISEMINNLKARYYNVEAVFFTNQLNTDTSEIAKLPWHSINLIENPLNNEGWENQIKSGAIRLGDLIIRYSKLN